MFRLNIDFPLGEDEEKAQRISESLIKILKEELPEYKAYGTIPENLLMQYRMSRDEDRTIKNYFVKDENGHCTRSKTQFMI